MKNSKINRRGFTLVEIAIVLVIIGLLLAGILKGQEIINNARVRALIERQNGLEAGWYSFIDRFAGLPGDYHRASNYLVETGNGNGDGAVTQNESNMAFSQLKAAGLLSCPQCTADTTGAPSPDLSLRNAYGGVMGIFEDAQTLTADPRALTAQRPRLQIMTGPRIPSNIMADVDRKIDDELANFGDFRFSKFDPQSTATSPDVGECINRGFAAKDAVGLHGSTLATAVVWRPAVLQSNELNCGGTFFL